MDKIRVQFIGVPVPDNKEDEFFRLRKVQWDPNGYLSKEHLSFHDYHIVFINYPLKYDYPSEQTGFLEYISGGGIVVTFLGPSNRYPWGEGYGRGNFLDISLTTTTGDSIVSKRDHWLRSIFRKYQFYWACLIESGINISFRENLEELTQSMKAKGSPISKDTDIFEIAATTVSNKCVSSVIHWNKGKVILLPLPKEISENLIRDIIDGIKENYITKEEISELKPAWVEKYILYPELKLNKDLNKIVKQFEEIKEKMERYEPIKKIFYTHGKELSSSIYLIFKEMGFNATLKEEEGRQDIEIRHNSFFAIIEAKGLKKYANNDYLRQLLDYYITLKENDPDVKGIFIVNHFRDRNPSERERSFSEAAIELAINNNFCLLTTIDLFKLYDSFLKNEVQTDQIVKLFENTKGLWKG